MILSSVAGLNLEKVVDASRLQLVFPVYFCFLNCLRQMNTALIINELELLPAAEQQSVFDYISFLRWKIDGEVEEDEPAMPVENWGGMVTDEECDLSEEQCVELDRRWAEYEANPESAVSWETLKEQLHARYGL